MKLACVSPREREISYHKQNIKHTKKKRRTHNGARLYPFVVFSPERIAQYAKPTGCFPGRRATGSIQSSRIFARNPLDSPDSKYRDIDYRTIPFDSAGHYVRDHKIEIANGDTGGAYCQCNLLTHRHTYTHTHTIEKSVNLEPLNQILSCCAELTETR